MADRCIGVTHLASTSDHFGVKLIIRLRVSASYVPRKVRPTFWKLNTSILLEEDFLPSFSALWNNIVKLIPTFSDIADWWDQIGKPEIKRFCISFSIQRKIRRDHSKKFLFSCLKIALQNKEWSEVCRIKHELGMMIQADAIGLVVRSRYKQNAEEEKASLYHLAKENNKRSNLSKLKINGSIVQEKDTIEKEVLKFYGAHFNGYHNSDLLITDLSFFPKNDFLSEFMQDLTELENTEKEKLHENIAVEELDLIVRDNNKSPGLDGLGYEF